MPIEKSKILKALGLEILSALAIPPLVFLLIATALTKLVYRQLGLALAILLQVGLLGLITSLFYFAI